MSSDSLSPREKTAAFRLAQPLQQMGELAEARLKRCRRAGMSEAEALKNVERYMNDLIELALKC